MPKPIGPSAERSSASRARQAATIRAWMASPQSAPFELGWSASLELNPARVILLSESEKLPGSKSKSEQTQAPALNSAERHIADADTLEAALTWIALGETPCCLVFCSARRPGGGWDNGAKAQEEDVALRSSWAIQAENARSFYALQSPRGALNSDALIHAPSALILLDAFGSPLPRPEACSFIGFAAPNAKGLVDQGAQTDSPPWPQLIRGALLTRMKGVFEAAKTEGSPRLILGAIGCGVFGLDPALVADCWAEALDRSAYAGGVCFAIPNAGSGLGLVFQQRLGLSPMPGVNTPSPALISPSRQKTPRRARHR